MANILVLNPPSPPFFDIHRDVAGGFGIAWSRPKRVDYGQSDSPVLQACLPYISSALRKGGFNFRILDCQLLNLNKQQVLADVKKESPDVIVSLIGLPSMKKDLELLRNLKETVTNTTIVGIGSTCKAVHDRVMALGGVDVVLRSEYPYISSLTDLVEVLGTGGSVKSVLGVSYIENDEVVSTLDSPEIDLCKVEAPSYDQLNPKDYHVYFTDSKGEKYEYTQILGSKGCHYGCFYCPYPVGYGNKVTFRSPKSIGDEIEFLHSVHGIRGFMFRDQSFTTSKKHALEVCSEIKARKLDIGWYTEARVNEVDRETLEAMKNSGCKRISYGVETGDPSLISGCKGGADLDIVKNAFDLTKETSIVRTANVIVGWPEETMRTLENTYNFVLSLKPDGVNCNSLVPYPGTKLREMALKDSLVVSDDFDEFTPDQCVMRTRSLTLEQLREAKRKMVQGFSKFQMKKALVEVVTGKRRHVGMKSAKNVFHKYISKN